jgi:hypothetical protein
VLTKCDKSNNAAKYLPNISGNIPQQTQRCVEIQVLGLAHDAPINVLYDGVVSWAIAALKGPGF